MQQLQQLYTATASWSTHAASTEIAFAATFPAASMHIHYTAFFYQLYINIYTWTWNNTYCNCMHIAQARAPSATAFAATFHTATALTAKTHSKSHPKLQHYSTHSYIHTSSTPMLPIATSSTLHSTITESMVQCKMVKWCKSAKCALCRDAPEKTYCIQFITYESNSNVLQ